MPRPSRCAAGNFGISEKVQNLTLGLSAGLSLVAYFSFYAASGNKNSEESVVLSLVAFFSCSELIDLVERGSNF